MLGSGCPPPLQPAPDPPPRPSPPPPPSSPPALKLAGKWEGVGVWPDGTPPPCTGCGSGRARATVTRVMASAHSSSPLWNRSPIPFCPPPPLRASSVPRLSRQMGLCDLYRRGSPFAGHRGLFHGPFEERRVPQGSRVLSKDGSGTDQA